MPVAVWIGGVIIDQQGRPVAPPTGDRVRDALARAGINATVDAEGVSVAPADAAKAEQVLITDRTLAGSGVNVILGVPAGSGRLSDGGVTVPLAPQPASRP
jgi:hypothetical protein